MSDLKLVKPESTEMQPPEVEPKEDAQLMKEESGPKPAHLSAPKPVGKPKPKSSNSKLFLVLGLVGAVVVLTALVVLALRRPTQKVDLSGKIRPTPTVIPRPTLPPQLLGDPSVYANDPQILELETAINALNAQINSDTLREPELELPTLEKGINLK